MKHLERIFALLPIALAYGCATSQPTLNVPGGKLPPPVHTSGTNHIPAGGLTRVPRIVVDDRPIEFSGFSLTPQERATFEKARSARINSMVEQRVRLHWEQAENDPRWILCIPVLPICAIGLPIAAGVLWMGEQTVGRIEASIKEPSLVSEHDGARLALVFKARATGASLGERSQRLVGSAQPSVTSDDEPPRLAIRITEARLIYSHREIGFSVTAEAQAFPSPSAGWSPTKHAVYTSSFRSAATWTANNDELVRQEIDSFLDALASSVWETYLPATRKLMNAEPFDTSAK